MWIRRIVLLVALCGILLVGTTPWAISAQKSVDEISRELEVKAEELKEKVEAFFAFKPNIFRDIEWKTRIEDLEGMVLLGDTETEALYRRRGDKLITGDLHIENKVYRFYNNQLLSIIITTKGDDNFKALKELAFKAFDDEIRFDDSLPEWFWVDFIGGGFRLLRYEEPLEKATLYLLSGGLYHEKKTDSAGITEPIKKIKPSQERPEWSYVISWKGNGAKTTESFKVKESWRIRWKNLGDILQIYVHNLNGDFIALPVNTLEKGADISYIYEIGEFYLTVNALGKWEVDIEEKTE